MRTVWPKNNFMRAVLVGLLGTVLVAGTAEALPSSLKNKNRSVGAAERMALERADQIIGRHRLVNKKYWLCYTLILVSKDMRTSAEFEVRENHKPQPPQCDADPETAPRMFSLKIDMRTGKAHWDRLTEGNPAGEMWPIPHRFRGPGWGRAVGAASVEETKEPTTACRLDGSDLWAKAHSAWSADKKRPDLDGKFLKVVRIASTWNRSAPTARKRRDNGMIAVLVESGTERFVAVSNFEWSTMPVERAYSVNADDKAVHEIVWGRRNREAEQTRFSGTIVVDEGPLAGLSLVPKDCVRPEDLAPQTNPLFIATRPRSSFASVLVTTGTLLRVLTSSVGFVW